MKQSRLFHFASMIFCVAPLLLAQTQGPADQQRERHHEVSPVRRIDRGPQPQPDRPEPRPAIPFRSIDGTGNNPAAEHMGAAHQPLLRLANNGYEDGVATMTGDDRPNPRDISNKVSQQTDDMPNAARVSSFLWQWGQFLDHDIDLTDGTDPPEAAPITIPTGDRWFDPSSTGTQFMEFNRSLYLEGSGTGPDNPRQQVNEITAWVDASNVYGSDETRSRALRTLDGSGKLATSEGNFLPFNQAGLPNAGGPLESLFLAGDVRANEQVGLAAMHTLFVREHNRLAERIARQQSNLTGDQIYERARRLVGAEMQIITYREFLPVLLGDMAPRPYRGYRPDVDASIANEFSTAAYRFGHSTLNTTILRLNRQGEPIAQGNLALRDAFFSPHRLIEEGGLAPVLRGLAGQICQTVDPFVIDDVRNFLFGPPGSGGFDLVSLNIQRGRDHGLASYNQTRIAMGLRPARNFGDISSDPNIRGRLAQAYDHVDQVDLWVGGLSEDKVEGALVGELFAIIIRDQFEALRDGDRFWYTRTLSPDERRMVENRRLSDIIKANTRAGDELPRNVFRVPR